LAELNEVFPDVFLVTGELVGEKTTLPRNMVLLRQGGELTAINSVKVDDDLERRIAGLGRITHLVKLGAFHGIDDPYYRGRHPDAVFWAPPESKHKGGIAHDRDLTEDSAPPVPGLSVFCFRTTRLPEAALLLPAGGGTLITCDAVSNVRDLGGSRGMERIWTAENGFLRPASIGLMWRNGMAREQGPSLLGDFQRLLELEFDNLLTGHGPPLIGGARDAVRDSAQIAFGVRRWPARVQ
jgi:hypothetical protein